MNGTLPPGSPVPGRSVDLASAIMEAAHVPLAVLDGDLRVVAVNQAYSETFRVSCSDAPGQSIYEIGEKVWNTDAFRSFLGEELPARFEISGFEIHASPDRSYLVNARVVLNESKRPERIVLAFEPLTDRTQEQSYLRRTALQLEEANKELEGFTYSVSHDLRAPLRAIDGFSTILIEEHTSELDHEGQRVANVIRKNTQRMGDLIDDLLVFSRIGRQTIQSEWIEMDKMARGVIDQLRAAHGDRTIDVHLGELPKACADPLLIRQVWLQLLENAFKYTRPRKTAIIRVEGETTENEVRYTVTDNGVGFDMQYAKKLFGMFQRLHAQAEFDGTGVGLALVQRIIRRHGGRVWVDGKVDGGATFGFALPREEEEDDD